MLYVNKLRVAGVLREPINSYYETIFETVRPVARAYLAPLPACIR